MGGRLLEMRVAKWKGNKRSRLSVRGVIFCSFAEIILKSYDAL